MPEKQQALRVPEWMKIYGIKEGEYLSLTKAQLKAKTRPCYPLKTRVWALGILQTSGYKGELAVFWMKETKKTRPLTTQDLINELHRVALLYYREAGIVSAEPMVIRQQGKGKPAKLVSKLRPTKEAVRRVLEELEEEGLAERKSGDVFLRDMNEEELRRLPSGRIQIYFYLLPRPAKPENVRQEWEEVIFEPRPASPEVANKLLPQLSIPQILKQLKIDPLEKSIFINPEQTQDIIETWTSARDRVTKIIEVAKTLLPQVATTGLPEVANPGGALEIKPFGKGLDENSAGGRASKVKVEEPRRKPEAPARPQSLDLIEAGLVERGFTPDTQLLVMVAAELGDTPPPYFWKALDSRVKRGRIGNGLVTAVAKTACSNYQAIREALEEDKRKSQEFQRAQDDRARREEYAHQERRLHLIAHPGDCEHCHGAGRYGAKERLCNCPAGLDSYKPEKTEDVA